MYENLLSLILDYKMNKIEAKAWKIAILYLQLAQQYFPDYKHYSIGKGDPRKTTLFRYTYKLVRECDELLEDLEYRLYITSQLQILKNIDIGGHPFISPNCLVGPKAWKRWLFWKQKFENTCSLPENTPVIHSSTKIIKAIDNTKKFLLSKFKELTKQTIIDSLESRAIFRWCALGEVSGFYFVLSPIVDAWVKTKQVNLLDAFTIDLNFYRNSITTEIEAYFKQEFFYEF